MEIQINIPTKAFSKVYIPLIDDPNRRKILYGGRDGGKSDFIAAMGVISCLQERYFRGLMIRKWKVNIKDSCYEKIKQIILRWGLEDLFLFLKSPLEIICKQNGNKFIAVGMDDPMKAKSLTDPTWAWYEECDQLTYYDYSTTTKGLRNSFGTKIQEWFSFNAGSPKSWIVREFFPHYSTFEKEDGTHTFIDSPRNNVSILHTCYKHNDFITQDRIEEYEQDQIHKPEEYKKSGLGLLVQDLTGIYYPEYKIIKSFPYDLCKSVMIGGDFGYADPNAFCRVGWNSKQTDLYLDELIYQTRMDDDMLINKMHEAGISEKESGYLDSSEPGTIQAINKAGFRGMKPAKKDKGSIMAGIKKVKSFNIHITERSRNLIDEIDGYREALDKYGNPTGNPIDENNHLMDAMRYPVYTHLYKGDVQNLFRKSR